jgi:hypothetical protein
MPLGVPEKQLRQMAAALLPYTASTSVAAKLGIHAEAALRALANRAGAVPATPGSPRPVRDREVSERHLRRRVAQTLPISRGRKDTIRQRSAAGRVV